MQIENQNNNFTLQDCFRPVTFSSSIYTTYNQHKHKQYILRESSIFETFIYLLFLHLLPSPDIWYSVFAPFWSGLQERELQMRLSKRWSWRDRREI